MNHGFNFYFNFKDILILIFVNFKIKFIIYKSMNIIKEKVEDITLNILDELL
jgi:hypothetical protein